MVYKDPIVNEVWKVREQLLEQHGNLEGFLDHIKKQEQEHPEKLVEPDIVKKRIDKHLAL